MEKIQTSPFFYCTCKDEKQKIGNTQLIRKTKK